MTDIEKYKKMHKEQLLKTLKELQNNAEKMVDDFYDKNINCATISIDISPYAIVTYSIECTYTAKEIIGVKND